MSPGAADPDIQLTISDLHRAALRSFSRSGASAVRPEQRSESHGTTAHITNGRLA